jgi:Ser/Thr protein kinase RdoA (MazF antagonist)
MDKRIRELYNDAILNEALARYGVTREDVRLLDGFESFIYEYEKDRESHILRISHSLHRTSDLTRGEIEWVNYLAAGGVPAARAVLSERGNLVEPLPVGDGSHFTAVSFERARGDHPTRADWENGLAGKMGQIMGRMHALTKDFEPSHDRFRRHTWYDDFPDGIAERYLPASETNVIDRFYRTLEYLHTLPQDRDSYGLVHVDFHGGNFFVADGQITLFDFDDCQYTWFIYDIAMALFYAIPHHCEKETDVAWARDFLNQFMAGYRRENTIAPEWMEQIPTFLKLREIDLYIIIHRSCDLDNLDPWNASYMRNRKYKIENDVPYVDMDFGGSEYD